MLKYLKYILLIYAFGFYSYCLYLGYNYYSDHVYKKEQEAKHPLEKTRAVQFDDLRYYIRTKRIDRSTADTNSNIYDINFSAFLRGNVKAAQIWNGGMALNKAGDKLVLALDFGRALRATGFLFISLDESFSRYKMLETPIGYKWYTPRFSPDETKIVVASKCVEISLCGKYKDHWNIGEYDLLTDKYKEIPTKNDQLIPNPKFIKWYPTYSDKGNLVFINKKDHIELVSESMDPGDFKMVRQGDVTFATILETLQIKGSQLVSTPGFNFFRSPLIEGEYNWVVDSGIVDFHCNNIVRVIENALLSPCDIKIFFSTEDLPSGQFKPNKKYPEYIDSRLAVYKLSQQLVGLYAKGDNPRENRLIVFDDKAIRFFGDELYQDDVNQNPFRYIDIFAANSYNDGKDIIFLGNKNLSYGTPKPPRIRDNTYFGYFSHTYTRPKGQVMPRDDRDYAYWHVNEHHEITKLADFPDYNNRKRHSLLTINEDASRLIIMSDIYKQEQALLIYEVDKGFREITKIQIIKQ